jgi:ATP-dependent helicase HrpB
MTTMTDRAAQPLPRLPIDDVLGDITDTLAEHSTLVLVAPPGAGKTTRVPLALLRAKWRNGGKIIVLEPRRLAARGAASHMATLSGTRLGEMIGLRARLETLVGPNTEIEVLTEGVFTRMIVDDPMLTGVAAVLFDEFHERSLDADLGLALARDAQLSVRPDLRLIVMSATLDGAAVAQRLDGAPTLLCEGRAFAVETRYLPRDPARRIEDAMNDAILRALRADSGSILAFLPGQREIERTAERLAAAIQDATIDILPLYGALDPKAQTAAVSPTPAGRRKIVLATSIAETSITIDGVRVVVDSGLARVPRHDPGSGLTRLETVRVSRAAADQRRGRAGRTEPGIAYRLWSEPETRSLAAYDTPEILNTDLDQMLLDLAAWGVTEPATLTWLDPPPAAAVGIARENLTSIGALRRDGTLTDTGRRIRELPLPPRLARMVLDAARHGAAPPAAELAAILVERSLGGDDLDLATRLSHFRSDRSERAGRMRRLARSWAERAAKAIGQAIDDEPSSAAVLLASAYPDRIGKARGAHGQFVLSNGRGAAIDATHPLASAEYIVVADLTGGGATSRILAAARLDPADLDGVAGDRITHDDVTGFDARAGSVQRRRTSRLGAIMLASTPLPVEAGPECAAALARGAADVGIDRLPWTREQQHLRDRVAFLRANDPAGDWPDISNAALAATVTEWLGPVLDRKTRLAEIDAETLGQALAGLIPWAMKTRLDAAAPTHFAAPTGNRHPIHYDGPNAPLLSIRVQELFGLATHPAIAEGRLPLTLELLSPAHRPMQITRDLPGFWRGSWAAVRADMRGRYPKHVWPEDPANAPPTARAKPRGT